MSKVRLRNWRERFNPGVEFVFRRPILWLDKQYLPGDTLPDDLKTNRGKLRTLWDAGRIELRDMVDTELPYAIEQRGNWYFVRTADGSEYKANGKRKLAELLKEIESANG